MRLLTTCWLGVLAAATVGATAVRVPGVTPYGAAASSRLWVEGGSSFRPYVAEASEFQAVLELRSDSRPAAEASAAATICQGAARHLELRVPVSGLRSGDELQEEHLRQALGADRHPLIRFEVRSYRATPAPIGSGCTLTLRGPLSIAGVTREIEVLAELRREASGLRLTGSRELRMTDYGIKPPVMMFGAIRIDDLLAVKFDLGVESD